MKAVATFVAAIVAVVILLYVATTPTAPSDDVTEAEIAQDDAEAVEEITARMDAYGELLKSKDVDWYSSYWAPNARFLAPGTDISGSEVITSTSGRWDSGEEFPAFEWEAFEALLHGSEPRTNSPFPRGDHATR